MSSLFNVFLFIGLIAASLSSVRAFTKEEMSAIQSTIGLLAIECKKEFGVNREEFIKAKESDMIDSLDPCLVACLAKKIGLINDKGEFDTEKSTEVIKMFLADEEAQNKAIEAIKICSSVNEQSVSDDEGCERAVLLIKCLEPFKDQFPL